MTEQEAMLAAQWDGTGWGAATPAADFTSYDWQSFLNNGLPRMVDSVSGAMKSSNVKPVTYGSRPIAIGGTAQQGGIPFTWPIIGAVALFFFASRG